MNRVNSRQLQIYSMRPKILIYAIGSLGDTIVSVPALRAVRAHFGSSAHIYLLHDLQDANRVTPETVLANTGLVDVFLNYSFETSFRRRIQTAVVLLARLRHMHFQTVVSLLPSERSERSLRRDRFFFSLCGIRRQIGFEVIPDSVIHPRTPQGSLGRTRHESQFRLERLKTTGILTDQAHILSVPLLNITSAEASGARQWLAAQRRHPGRTLVAIGPGCKQPAHLWPLENFSDLGRRLISLGGFELVVVGGPSERNDADRLLNDWGQGISCAGRFSVTGSAAILQQCKLLVGLDTGSTHLAAAVGTPCIVIQGARSSPGQWDPLGPDHLVIRKQVPCEGCSQFRCPKPDHPCMKNTTVDEVWAAVESACLVHLGRP
jgi:ADP-heptose:LPS heptosyltransferase